MICRAYVLVESGKEGGFSFFVFGNVKNMFSLGSNLLCVSKNSLEVAWKISDFAEQITLTNSKQ